MFKKLYLSGILIFFISLVTFLSSQSEAADVSGLMHAKGLLFNADDLYRDSEKGIIELSGHVQVIFKGQHLSCEKAVINLNERHLEASGEVLLVSDKATIGAQKIVFNYETNTGMIYSGYVESGPVIFEGEIINKISDTDYFATQSQYTACMSCPAAWSFGGSTIKAELGGYAYIKNSIVRFGGFPVLWMPYLVVPLKSDRQSGLLTPSFESSGKGGLALSDSFFWAINPSQDATIGLKNYEFRGLKTMVNYRYVLTPQSDGELDFYSIRDRALPRDPRMTPFETSPTDAINRWYLKYHHFYELPHGVTNRVSINTASDLQYPQDFSEETRNLGDPALESRVSFSKNTESTHSSIDGSYYYDMLQANPLAGNDGAVHRMPEIKYSIARTRLGNSDTWWWLDVNYVNFAREGFAFDNISTLTNTDGTTSRYVSNTTSSNLCDNDPNCRYTHSSTFNPATDLIRTGQRFDFKPTISHPFSLGDRAQVIPTLQYDETHYNLGAGDDPLNVRRLARAQLRVDTTLSRVFGDSTDAHTNRLKHEVVPYVSYTVIPWLDQAANPFFGTTQQASVPFSSQYTLSDSALNGDKGLQFDFNDLVYDRNVVTFGVTNKFIRKRWIGDVPDYSQIATLKIFQSYDFYQDQQGGTYKQPLSDLTTILTLQFDHLRSNSTLDYMPYQKVTNVASDITFNNDFGHFIQLGLTRSYQLTPTFQADFKTRTENYRFGAGRTGSNIDFMAGLTYDGNNSGYTDGQKFSDHVLSWGYLVNLKPPGNCWIIRFKQYKPIAGDPVFKLDFAFLFDGKNPVGMSTKELDFQY